MKRMAHVPGAILPTVMVVSALLLLTVLAVASLWEADFLFFSKHRHEAAQRANVESGFVLWAEHPEAVLANLDADSTLLLYDSVARSRIRFRRRNWGLYEIVTVCGYDGRPCSSKIMGRRSAGRDGISFYYRNNNSSLALTGKTHLKGRVRMPRSGVVYGQMGSVFFSGGKIGPDRMGESGRELPEPEPEARKIIRELRSLREMSAGWLAEDSLGHWFSAAEPLVTAVGEELRGCRLAGNIVLVGDDIGIDATCSFSDIIIVGNRVRVGEGFSGSVQIFASDSLHIENNVTLEYPSGLYSEKYIGIGDGTEVNGYAIVDTGGKSDVRNANYRQSRLSVVRGLVWISGTAQFQGIVSGAVFLEKAVYYSARGYYENMICDAAVLENTAMAWPFWLSGPSERKEVKWVL